MPSNLQQHPKQEAPAIPNHELLKRIGRGSYGDVWLARTVLGQHRAVKMVHRASFEDERPFEREFEGIRRFEPISRSHPSQLNILHVGRGESYFFYVMELADAAEVAGEGVGKWEGEKQATAAHSRPPMIDANTYTPQTLRSLLSPTHFPTGSTAHRRRLPPAECVEIGLALTTALAHLHAHGLVHRDIKPSNIIFVGGVPKLADIGLVTDIDASRSFVGTEGFLPPEGPGTPQADLYSLGKVLYEMSTGRDRKDYPALPLDWDALDAAEQARLLELNEVLVKVCEADPQRRYQTAEELSEDLALLNEGQSIRRKRKVERRTAFAKVVGIVVVMIALLSGFAGFLATRQSQQKEIRRQQAHKLFLAGKAHADRLTKNEFSKAVELYHQAIAIDPTHAPAYVGLAETYVSVSGWHLRPKEAMAQAKWAITKALELDDKSAAAHAWLGKIKASHDWDWVGAEQEFRRAIELAPQDAAGYASLAIFHQHMGRFDEAAAELAQAQRLSQGPSHRDDYDAGMLLFWQRKYEPAISLAQRALARDTNSVLNHFLLMDCYLKAKRYEEAITEATALRALDDAPHIVAELGHIHAVMGHTNEARQILADLDQLSSLRYVSTYFKGFVHLGLGENALALDCLEGAYEERFGWLGTLRVDPFWDELRPEPRFQSLLKKMALDSSER